jgi:basic amino acid/polyamine antiporter, APA family
MTSTVPDTGPSARRTESALYTRKATGLVRQIPLADTILFNATSTYPIGIGLTFTILIAGVAFPRANIVLAILLGLVGCAFVWVTFALLTAAMPKVGGDYVINGRSLGPPWGLVSNLCAFVAALLSIGFFSVYGVRFGLAPILQTIGTETGSHWFTTASATILHRGWTIAIAVFITCIPSAVAMTSSKRAIRLGSVCYLISLAGFIIAMAIIGVSSHATFVAELNRFSFPFTHVRDTYGQTIAHATKSGLALPVRGVGYSFDNTLGATFFVLGGALIWSWWGLYIAVEMKGAGRRSRQLWAVLGAGYGQGLLLLLTVVLLQKTIGYNFLAAAGFGAYAVPVTATYPFFASVLVPGQVLAILLALSFLPAFISILYANFAMMARAPFAWAIDGLAPQWLVKVNDRTHTPNRSIVCCVIVSLPVIVWAAVSKSFVTTVALFTMVGYVTILLTGITAVTLRRRRAHLYAGSPADWMVKGVPVLPVAGLGAVLFVVINFAIALHFHANLGITHVWLMIALPILTCMVGLVWFYIARAVQLRRGVDIDLMYRSVPED